MVMTTHDQNKKTLRHFQCRDYLWEVFEQMSTELECSTDYLINEAMRQYARSRNYGTSRRGSALSTQPPPSGNTPVNSNPSSGAIPSLREGMPARSSAPLPPPRPSRQMAAPGGGRMPSSSLPPAPRSQPSGSHRPMQQGSMPPPLPGGGMARPAPPQMSMRQQLFVIFNGQKMPVNKDEFIIGRGSKSADLAIKDGNISRRHAAVVLHNGAYYMKDLGSTNGIEFQGHRFDTKRIEEGDIFRICDYEVRFTYQ